MLGASDEGLADGRLSRKGVMESGITERQAAATEQDAEAAGYALAASAAEAACLAGDAGPANAVAGDFGTASLAGRHKPVIGPRTVRAQSTVALARRAPDIRAIWGDHRMDPAFREAIMVAVASANSCRHCSFAHREWALAAGLPESELAALEGMDPAAFDARRWAAIAWAHAAARNDFNDVPESIEANFRREFTPAEQADIELVARTMTWMNEISNTVDAAWSRVRRRAPVPDSRLPRELRAVLLYGIAVPPILVMLGVWERRNPISLVLSMPRFFREFDQRSRTTSAR
jgi:AhpD family alkylhydroperoxidase